MLSNLAFSINAVLPIFLVMIFGGFIKRRGFLSDITVKQMNDLVFRFALPAKLFLDLQGEDISQVMDGQLLVYAVGATFVSLFTSWAIASFFVKDKKQKGSFIQGCFRSNFAIIGLPLLTNLLGKAPGEAAVITTVVIPLYNILSAVVFAVNKEEGGGKGQLAGIIKSALANIIKNPLILSVLVGIVFSYFKIPIFKPIYTSIKYLGDSSTPMALLAIGGGLNFSEMKSRLGPTVLAVFIKLVATPVVLLTGAMAFGLSNTNVVILFVLFAAPTALTSYVMAENMGGDGTLASNIILGTSMGSVFTYTIGVYILRTMGVI